MLPAALHKPFFLQSSALEPIVRLLDAVQEHEKMRLQIVLPQGLQLSSPDLSKRRLVVKRQGGDAFFLSNKDYVTVISQRLERLDALQAKLKPLAEGDSRSVPTSQVMPLIDRLHTAMVQLEIALDADVKRCPHESRLSRWMPWPDWSVAARLKLLTEELEAVRVIKRRCEAVKSDSELI